jgi:hypothetical protein
MSKIFSPQTNFSGAVVQGSTVDEPKDGINLNSRRLARRVTNFAGSKIEQQPYRWPAGRITGRNS